MDATAGDGDPFWELYAEHLLPPPEEVTLPMAWGPELLQQLQHDAIVDGAQKQQVRACENKEEEPFKRLRLHTVLVAVAQGPELLQQLQHGANVDGAKKQQVG
jgi:hypothetical protein